MERRAFSRLSAAEKIYTLWTRTESGPRLRTWDAEEFLRGFLRRLVNENVIRREDWVYWQYLAARITQTSFHPVFLVNLVLGSFLIASKVMTDFPMKNTSWVDLLPEKLYPREMLQAERQTLRLLNYNLYLSAWTRTEFSIGYLADEVDGLEVTQLIDQERINVVYYIRSLISNLKNATVVTHSRDLAELEGRLDCIEFGWQISWYHYCVSSWFPGFPHYTTQNGILEIPCAISSPKASNYNTLVL